MIEPIPVIKCGCDCHDSGALECSKCNENSTHDDTKILIHRRLLQMFGKEYYEKLAKIKMAYFQTSQELIEGLKE